MTPLPAIENISFVQGAPATRYKRNPVCANPECDNPSETTHHIFGRPPGPHSGSWFAFVPLATERTDIRNPEAQAIMSKRAIPHGTGLCGTGTTGCHGNVEQHLAWIKYEDGVFNWYRRNEQQPPLPAEVDWELVGPLDPQPSQLIKQHLKRKRKQAQERRERSTISFSKPKDHPSEDWAGIIDDALEQFEELWVSKGGGGKPRTRGYTVHDAILCGLLWMQAEASDL